MATDFLPASENFARLFLSENWEDVNLAKRQVLKGIDKIRPLVSELYGKISKGPVVDTTKPYWLEERTRTDKLVCTLSGSGTTLTVTGNLFGQTITRDNMLKVVRNNARLRHDDGSTTTIADVTAVDATLPQLTVAAGSGTSMPADGASQTWYVIGEPATDAEDAHTPRFQTRKFRYATSELFTDLVTIELTRENTAMEGIGNEFIHQLELRISNQEWMKARSLICGWPRLTGGGEPKSTMEDERSTLIGLDFYPEYLFGSGKEYENSEILMDLEGVAMEQDHVNRMIAAMEANGTNFNEGNWLLVAPPNIIDLMQTWGLIYREMTQDSREVGFSVERVRTKRGVVVNIARDWFIPEYSAVFVNLSSLQYRPFKGMEFLRGEISKKNVTSKQVQIASRIVGLIMRNCVQSVGKFKRVAMAA